MKKILIGLLFFLPLFLHSQELELEVNPIEPVLGERFNVYFNINTESSEEPEIDFNPINLEVVGRANQGVSTRSTYINGKFSVSRKLIYVYEFSARVPGMAFLKNIKVKIGGDTLTHEDLNIKILSKPKKLSSVFLQAEVNKENVYVGEAVTVNYYVYHSVNLLNFDILKFPELDKFLKRYIQVNSRPERVEIQGKVFTRQILYSAVVFPESPGKYSIDSMKVNAQFADQDANDPFAGFGFAMRNVRKRDLSSPAIELEAIPLPFEGKPENFSGLVGKHSAKLEMNRSKFLVNEPIELKLILSGPGALESLLAPKIFSHQDLEEFESGGELKPQGDFSATKTFQYTYLARGGLLIPASEFKLSYFDPTTKEYQSILLSIPLLEVEGSAAPPRPSPEAPTPQEKNSDAEKPSAIVPAEGIFAPYFTARVWFDDWVSWANRLLLVLLIVLFSLQVGPAVGQLIALNKGKGGDGFLNQFKNDPTYENFYKCILQLNPSQEEKNIRQLIEQSSVGQSDKKYLLKTLEDLERASFSHDRNKKNIQVEDKLLRQLKKILKKTSL